MSPMTQDDASRQVLNESQQETFPYEMNALGIPIVVYKDVFSPKHFNGWKMFTRNFPKVDGLEVLEVGCGTGVTSLYLAKHGAQRVVAVDINPAAVENTQKNIEKNNLINMEARFSDIFSGIKPGEQFDVIYWNTPFLYQDETYTYRSVLERGLFDPGYKLTDRFLQEAPQYLKKNGYVLFGTGDFGDVERFKKIADAYYYTYELLKKEDSVEIYRVDFQLYKLVPPKK
jgi:release factor glutamine methyltransferase